MKKQKPIFAGAGLAGALAIAVFAFSLMAPPQAASAHQIARDASQALTAMTPSEQTASYDKFRPHFQQWLTRAQQAKDLQVLTYDQVITTYPHAMEQSPVSGEPLRILDNPADGATPNVRELRYLRFTMTDGDAKIDVIVGVNTHNIPEAAMTNPLEPSKPRVNG